ncbi:MAG TPA: NERD domain-containing protein/DEAD/DEAH box helicase [Chloroflexia bacterium]|nr:NERD domain-containing protein/DEAD/DEAH box helicase [Chloroflexia bacterium]
MAQMFPNQVQWDLPKQIAEKKVYDAFRLLPDPYIVFHSVQWQFLDNDGRPQDGEADFVIAHPDHGVLVIEVKGGQRISFDDTSGKWFSMDGAGNTHGIKDPVRQAMRSKYNLKKQLAVSLNTAESAIPIGHAVAFPAAFKVSGVPLRADLSPDIILDNGDLADPALWLDQVWSFYRGYNPKAHPQPPRGLINALRNIIGRSFEFHPAIWGQFVDENNEMIRLTQEQYDVLEALQMHNRALIWGCAGSGKTLIAAEKAIRLARQGLSVLLTCFNKGLASFLKERLSTQPDFHQLPLTIVGFHDLCVQLAVEAGIPLVQTNDQSYFSEVLPMALMEAAEKLHVQYDALIVDEGQDFQDDWWATLQSLLRYPDESILYIFYDEQQRIYPDTGKFPITGPPYLLTRNCRNTRLIHRQMLKFYTGSQKLTAQGPQGRPVQIVHFDPATGVHPTLASVLKDITGQGNVPHDQIVVLTPSRQHTQLWDSPLPGNITLGTAWPPLTNQIYSTTIHAFKGLEASVIILVDLDRWQTGIGRAPIESVLYVACSRARNHLAVLLPTVASSSITRHFK